MQREREKERDGREKRRADGDVPRFRRASEA